MTCVGSEPTITASERAKTVQVLDRVATVTGIILNLCGRNLSRRAENLCRGPCDLETRSQCRYQRHRLQSSFSSWAVLVVFIAYV
jgi:hypothetical protein